MEKEEKPLSEDEFCVLVQNVNWDLMLKRLLLFTIKMMQHYHWLNSNNEDLPRGLEATDFVQSAITKILTGQRTLLRQEKKFQDFTEHDIFLVLASIISSDINHLAESKENKITFRLETLPHWINTPSTALAENITNEESQKEILASLEEDSVAELVAKTIMSGQRTPNLIAKETKLSIGDVYNAFKRIRRKLKKTNKI